MSAAPLTLVDASVTTADRSLTGLEAAAAYLGLGPDELAAWLDHGGTLPALARALGRSADDAVAIVVAHELGDEPDRLRRRVAAGGWHPRPDPREAPVAA
jgi:hypothetical protein